MASRRSGWAWPALVVGGVVWWTHGRELFRVHVLPRLADRIYRQRMVEFDADVVRPGEVVLLGDSITHYGHWQRWFPDLPVRNLGISGDTTRGLRRRLHHVVDSAPEQIFLLIGTNDLFLELPREETLANVAFVLDELQAALPDAEIHVQSVMPRHRRWAGRIRELNTDLEALTAARGLHWVDLWPALSGGADQIPFRYAYDLLHPNARGYEAWLRVLRPLVGREG